MNEMENFDNLEDLLDELGEIDTTVTLTDEEGRDIVFEFLDIVQLEDREYVILLPQETAQEGKVCIFRIEGEGENESYVGLDSEEEAEAVFAAFKQQAMDDFDFLD